MPRFGGYFHPFPQKEGVALIERAERRLHRPVDVVMWYQLWGADRLDARCNLDWITSVGTRDVLIKWEPQASSSDHTESTYSIAKIVRGEHDEYVRSWAEAIAQLGRRVYLCPMPEMNGSWFPWSRTSGQHSPADYIEAWRHIHDVFAAAEATEVKWVWAPYAGDMPADNRMEDYFPGGAYVDVLGLSVYNWGTARSWSSWRSFDEIIQPYYDRIATLGDQPIWITEMGCTPDGGDKAAWIRAMWEYVPRLRRVETVLWFDVKKETDWRITAAPAISRQFWLDERPGRG